MKHPQSTTRSGEARVARRILFTSFAAAVCALVATAAFAQEKKPPTPNPVQIEMRLLEAALRDAVSAIASGDVRSLPKQLHAVHTAAGDTGAALKSGEYKPPQNADRVARFIELDAAFHKEMITMVKAARKNDVDKTAVQLGVLMQRCHGCHTEFRAPPSPRATGTKASGTKATQ